MPTIPTSQSVALITGGARRIGAAIARTLHEQGFRLVIHYRHSETEARQLANEFNQRRENSTMLVQANLSHDTDIKLLANAAINCFGRLDALINNASSFYPTPIGQSTLEQWDDLFGSNAKAPFFLCQALAPELSRRQGAIVNIADIHAERPLKEHTLYCMAKAANIMLTQSLARELAPEIRVNGIAPGAILWPAQTAEMNATRKQTILEKVPLQRQGHPDNIAATVKFLLLENPYITGQIIRVDGGRSLMS